MNIVQRSPAQTPRRTLSRSVKALGETSGLYRLARRRRADSTLLVLGYHRVLPEGHPHWEMEIPGCTITDADFERTLALACRYFEPVSAAQVAAAVRGGPSLPRDAVLITFDDGWHDTLTVAGPIMRRHKVPSVVFIPPAIFDGPGPFWQEVLTLAVLRGQLDAAGLDGLAEQATGRRPAPHPQGVRATLERCIALLTDCDPSRRDGAIAAHPALQPDGSQHFMVEGDAAALDAHGIDVGGHGYSHNALTTVPDSAAELRHSRERLSRWVGREVLTMSVPHSRFTPKIAAQALAAGYQAVGTGHIITNELVNGAPTSPLLGRHFIEPGQPNGELIHAWLAGRAGVVDAADLEVRRALS